MQSLRKLLISLLKGLNFVVRKISAFTHFVQFGLQWGFHPRPEWFDHYLDQHWQFSAKNNGLWVERGVFSRMVLKPNSKMLEICCGDGLQCASLLLVQSLLDHSAGFRPRRDSARQAI